MLTHFLHSVSTTGIDNFLDHLTEGIILINPQGIIKSVNQIATDWLTPPNCDLELCDQPLVTFIPAWENHPWQYLINCGWQPLTLEQAGLKLSLEYQVIPLPAPPPETLTGYAVLLRSNTQERFALAVEGSHDGLWDWDMQTDYAYFSPRWKEILGYTDAELPNRITTWENALHPEDRPQVMTALEAYLAGESPTYEVEFRARHKDGNYRWILARGIVLRDRNGQPYRMAGSHTDITERKEAEAALLQSQHFIRQIADATPSILYIYDIITQSNIYINREIQVLLGYTPTEVQATGSDFLLQIIHPEDIGQLPNHFQQIMQAGDTDILEIEYRVRDVQGKWHWLSGRNTVFRRTPDGQVQQILGIATDVTERKHAEDSLRASEDKFRHIFQDAPIGMALTDITGTLIQVNSAYCQLLGYTEAQLTNLNFTQITHPADLKENLRNFQRLCRQEITHYQMENRYIHQQGHIIWVNLSVALIFDHDSKIRYILGMVENITERKKTEEYLKLQERAMAASSNGIVICDAQKRHLPITYVNPAFEKITGYSISEALGNNCRFLQGGDREQLGLEQLREAIQAGESCTVILRNYRKDGNLFWNELTVSPIYDEIGQMTHFIGIQNDITERKQAEDALLRTQTRLQYLLAASPGILYTLEAKPPYRVTFISNHAKTILGYELGEIQKPHFWLNHVHPEDRESVLKVGLQPLWEDERYQHEYRFQNQDGSYCWIYDQLRLIRDSNHHPLEIIGYWTDITELKQVEEELKASLKEKEVLLKEIHHRVKNNLQIISSLLKLQSSMISDPAINSLFQDSYNRVRSMALIHEKLYRTENLTLIDATDYIQNLTNNLLSCYSHQSLNLTLEIDPVTLDINTAIPCGLIITELVSNSLKYAFHNHPNPQLKIKFLQQAPFLTLIVQDNGVGVSADFEPETSESLGLQLVVNLTEQLDGTLTLDRTLGTCFIIKFTPAHA